MHQHPVKSLKGYLLHHFSTVLNNIVDGDLFQNQKGLSDMQISRIRIAPPRKHEITSAIKKTLKTNKAAGLDGILAEADL